MSVFDDPMKELEQLQAQLLEQEDWFERELDSAKRLIGEMPEPRKTKASAAPKAPAASANTAAAAPVRNYANNYGAQSVRKQVKQAENYDRDEYMPKKKGLGGLLTVACIELLGILGILGYWALVLLK